MAILTSDQKKAVLRNYYGHTDREHLVFGDLTKADIDAAVTAVDAFFEANVGAINNAFPQPARAEMSAREKAMLVTYVIRERYGV